MKILTSEQMRRAEQACAEVGLPADALMENAGKVVAEEVRRISGVIEQPVLILIGPGNNGGDGLVAARYLDDWGARVSLYIIGKRSADDANLELVRQRGITCVEAADDSDLKQLDRLLSPAALVIDALLGTGKSRPLDDILASVLNRVGQFKKKHLGLRIIALDLPSGLNADSGAADTACLYADNTITLGFPKTGLFNFPGAERVGKITVVDIGIPLNLVDLMTAEMITAEWVRSVLPARPPWANKGTFGKVLVVAGSINYIGAAYLACNGVLRVGAGLVTLATAASLQPMLAAKLTETTYLPLIESNSGIISPQAVETIKREMANYDVLLIGCGLGQNQSVSDLVKSTLFDTKITSPLVLDADVLNVLATIPDWWRRLPDDAILTPHPGEMARLTGMSVEEVQSDRAGITEKMARHWRKTVVLKGAHTVISSPKGKVRMSPTANSGLASAGTGDVLVGVVAGMVAQGLSFFDAASAAVYLHAEAGEVVKERLGDAGMLASDLLPVLPQVIKQLKVNR